MLLFRWDEGKAAGNKRKHGILFDDAILVFDDPHAIAEVDRVVEGEVRWQTIGMLDNVVLLLVAHTVEEEEQDEIVRIISARRANRTERKRYEQNRHQDFG